MVETRAHRYGSKKRLRVLSAVCVAAAITVELWHLNGGTATAATPTAVKVTRGDLIVSVGGVGQIAQIGGAGQPATAPAGAATTLTTDTSGAPIFPRSSGQLTAYLVTPGQHVAAGDPVAVVDDGGASAAAIGQARSDVAIARLELRQRQTSDPLRGTPPTRAELDAGRAAFASARARLARVLSPPRKADVSVAKLDLERAKADLETLLGGPAGVRADAVLIAEQNVEVAQLRLDRMLAPPNPADIAAARAELAKAEADLETLVRNDRTQPVTQKEIDAARAAIEAARLKLERVLAPADPADIAAARAELERTRVELRKLLAGPSPTARSAARQAVVAARTRLRVLLSPPLEADVLMAQLDVRRAVADIAILRARRAPSSKIEIALARAKADAAQSRLGTALLAAGPLTVRSPSAGTITALLTTPGAHIDPAIPVATIADLGRLGARVELSEFDIAQVTSGQAATVNVDALGGKIFPGEVLFAGLTGTNATGVVTFPVQITLHGAEGLKPGMNVSVRIVVATRHDVVRVPLEVVSQDGDEAIVTVLDSSGQPVTRPVTLGLANNKEVEVVKGLRVGQLVVPPDSTGAGA